MVGETEPASNGIGFEKPALPRRLPIFQVRLALGFLRETEPEMVILVLFRCAITHSFAAEGVHWLH